MVHEVGAHIAVLVEPRLGKQQGRVDANSAVLLEDALHALVHQLLREGSLQAETWNLQVMQEMIIKTEWKLDVIPLEIIMSTLQSITKYQHSYFHGHVHCIIVITCQSKSWVLFFQK